MIEKVVYTGFDILHPRLTVRYDKSGQELFFPGLVKLIEHLHLGHVDRLWIAEVRSRTTVRHPGKNFGELANVGITIRRYWISVAVELLRAVEFEFEKPDREQLHYLPGIVLVGKRIILGIGLAVVDVAEIDAHRRMHRDGT